MTFFSKYATIVFNRNNTQNFVILTDYPNNQLDSYDDCMVNCNVSLTNVTVYTVDSMLKVEGTKSYINNYNEQQYKKKVTYVLSSFVLMEERDEIN